MQARPGSRSRLPGLGLCLLLLAGCGRPATENAAPPMNWTAEDVLIRVLPTPQRDHREPNAPPSVTLYADGWLVTRADGNASSLPRLQARKLGADAVSLVLNAALAAGLDSPEPATPSPIPATTVVFRHQGRQYETSFPVSERGTPATGFVSHLKSPETWLSPGPPTDVPISRLALGVIPRIPAIPAPDWPTDVYLPATNSDCTVLQGDDALALTEALGDTPVWTRDGESVRVVASPLLPDQPGC